MQKIFGSTSIIILWNCICEEIVHRIMKFVKISEKFFSIWDMQRKFGNSIRI